jgi:hypothetical protein
MFVSPRGKCPIRSTRRSLQSVCAADGGFPEDCSQPVSLDLELRRGSDSWLGLFWDNPLLHDIPWYNAKSGVVVVHGHVATPHPFFRRFIPPYSPSLSFLLLFSSHLPRPAPIGLLCFFPIRTHEVMRHNRIWAVGSFSASPCFALHDVIAEVLCNVPYYFF